MGVDGGKANGLDADRARAGELQRRYVDLGEVGGVGTVGARWINPGGCLSDRGTIDREAGGIALGQGLDGFGFGE